jgi:hypothetical protein
MAKTNGRPDARAVESAMDVDVNASTPVIVGSP